MTLKFLYIMDVYEGYPLKKDTSHLLMLESHRRGHAVYYGEAPGLSSTSEGVQTHCAQVEPVMGPPYFHFQDHHETPLSYFDCIVMRRDPPYDMAYLYTTQMLLSARPKVINDPLILATVNEKRIITQWPQYTPSTLITSRREAVDQFVDHHDPSIILKDLGGFAAQGTYKVEWGSSESLTHFSMMTQEGRHPIMVQPFLAAVSRGEKRVLFIEGDVLGMMRRDPPENSFITNPDSGATLHTTTLTPQEEKICHEVGCYLKEHRIFMAGIDLIDEKLIEVNITSPGLLWELNAVEKKSFEKIIVDQMEQRCASA
jgi:glutathione synthase